MSRYIDLDQIEFLKVDGNKEFNHGVDCCINKLLEAETIEAVPIDKVKQAREKIAGSLNGLDEEDYAEKVAKFYIERDLRILDKLIAESEE